MGHLNYKCQNKTKPSRDGVKLDVSEAAILEFRSSYRLPESFPSASHKLAETVLSMISPVLLFQLPILLIASVGFYRYC